MRLHRKSETVYVIPTHPARAPVERLIRDSYIRRYSATVRDLPSRLVAVFGPDAEPLAACGILNSQSGFFSEYYLDQPIERHVSQACTIPIERGQIIEVVSLAGTSAPAVRRLMQDVIESIQRMGRSAGVFTSSTVLKTMIERIGVPALRIADADRARVPNPEDWGRYYDDKPSVFVVPSRTTIRFATDRQACDSTLRALWSSRRIKVMANG